jgi:uncharacterized protein with PIN domain
MIVDTSALIAIPRDEPEAQECARTIETQCAVCRPAILSKLRSS